MIGDGNVDDFLKGLNAIREFEGEDFPIGISEGIVELVTKKRPASLNFTNKLSSLGWNWGDAYDTGNNCWWYGD